MFEHDELMDDGLREMMWYDNDVWLLI